MGLQVRLFEDGDLPAFSLFLKKVRTPNNINDYPSLSNMPEIVADPNNRATMRLWWDGVALVAYAFVDKWHNLRFEYMPAFSHTNDIVTWGITCLQARQATLQQPNLALDSPCRDDDDERLALLHQHGFVKLSAETVVFERTLLGVLPMVEMPANFTIRPFNPATDMTEWVALHRAAHGTDSMTAASRLSWATTPNYDPALDLIAFAPTGKMAGYCFCQIEAEENEISGRNLGYTDPIATHPAWQGMGVAAGLIRAGMGLLRERRMDVVGLATLSKNAGMIHTAEKLRFQIVYRKLWLRKQVSI